jgi:hypothetical protein
MLNMFRATHRSSSGAQNLQLQPVVLHTFMVAGSYRQPQTYVKPEKFQDRNNSSTKKIRTFTYYHLTPVN